MINPRSVIINAGLVLLFAATAAAQDPTPTAVATATPTVEACAAAQTCMDAAVPAALTSCLGSCTVTNTDKFALSAGTLAARSIENSRCSARKTKAACNACYQRAKLPLRVRYDGKIFHGLLAQAITIIEAQRQAVCKGLGR